LDLSGAFYNAILRVIDKERPNDVEWRQAKAAEICRMLLVCT